MRTIFQALFVLLAASVMTVSAATFTVNTTADTPDANPGDEVCSDAGASCSVRAAITESNTLAGADTINIPTGFYTQSQLATSNEDANANGDWDSLDSVTINGTPPPDPNNPVLTVLQASSTPTGGVERVLPTVN